MRRLIGIALLLLVGGCHPAVSPEQLHEWQSRTLFTCCNLYYESDRISDANYHVGSTLPFGSPASVTAMTNDSITFTAGATPLTIVHSYGLDQESAQQYFGKILVPTDPHTTFAAYPRDVQAAITDGRVEIGMTKEQVIMSLGYPPTHRTASTALNTWVYWQNRWVTYQVQFAADGTVSGFVGNAPTHNQPIVAATPVPPPPVRTIRRKR